MGPRSCERGNVAGTLVLTGPNLLQWGRARASAEIRGAVWGAVLAAYGFNGAALVRARKSSECGGSLDDWRCFNGAALVRARKSAHRAPGAGTAGCSLQWGRARASAEISTAIAATRIARPRFNGAALVRARKSLCPPRPSPQARTASMGPRSCERGNAPLSTDDVCSRAASMGPRSCERGNVRQNGRWCSIRVALQWGRARASAEM